MLGKIFSVKDIVYHVLLNYPEARDNDELLRFKVHAEQQGYIRSNGFTLDDYARLCINNQLASHESIRRTRQKLQELHPALRGRTYNNRQTKAEPEMREGMKSMYV